MITKLTTLTILSLGALYAEDRPNFVWVISEDNSKHHLKHFDPTGIATPHIEALAKDGVTFDATCSNGAVCSVARSTLLTGCQVPRIGAQYHRKQQTVPMPKGLQPFPFYLKEAGYYTSNKGKTDYNVQIDFKSAWSGKSDWKKKKKGQPFFYQLSSLNKSHESSGHFPKAAIEQGPLDDLAKNLTIPPHHPDTKTMRYSYAAYQKRIQVIDGQVGELIQQLKADGVYDNTIIFYFGDHGGILPRSKGYAYETGLNAPLVIRFPDKWKHLIPFKKGTRTNVNVNFYDFGPTLIHAAGIKVNEKFDGKPFLGKGITAESLEDRPSFGHADRFDEKYDLVRTLRKGDMKYMRSYQPFNTDGLHNFYRYKSQAYQELRQLFRAGKLNKQQSQFFEKRAPEGLFDLTKDPYELNNLANDPKFATTLKAMRTELAANARKINDLSFYPESHLISGEIVNHTAYGEANSKQISKLIAIADLQLQPFAKAKIGILAALEADDPWQRYWGCISATRFANRELFDKLKKMAISDTNRLVRVRAAEYLAHVGEPQTAIQVITQAAKESDDPVEINLILNSAAMVHEMDPENLKFNIPASALKTLQGLSKHRVQYLLNKE